MLLDLYVAFSPTLRAWHSRHGISVALLLALLVADLKVILLQLLQPTRQLSLWFSEILQPHERTMVGSEKKPSTQEVRAEVVSEGDDSEKLSPGDTVVALGLAEKATGMCDHMLSPIVTNL